METEAPYYDQKGNEIKEFSVLRVYHFTGVRRKRHYMYKWVRLVESQGKLWWAGFHLVDGKGGSYWLKATANPETRRVEDALIVQ